MSMCLTRNRLCCKIILEYKDLFIQLIFLNQDSKDVDYVKPDLQVELDRPPVVMYQVTLPVITQILWGISQFCFSFLASFTLMQSVL